MELNQELSQLIQQLYRTAYQCPMKDFKTQSFDLVSHYLPIDSGTWISRSEQKISFFNEDAFTYQLPANFIEDYHHLSTVSTQVHQVFGVMLGNLGKTMDILDVVPEDEWFGSDMYNLYCKKFNLHHSLMTVTINPNNQAMNVITFARHQPEKAFSLEEKQTKEILVPNLVEALRVNILNSFEGQRKSAHRAVLDRYGNVVEAEEGFLNLIHSVQLWQDNKIALELKEDHGHIEHGKLIIDYTNHNGLVYVEAEIPEQQNHLTGRKRDICELLIEGKTNKEIAKVLNIAPNTVNNHLKEVFKLLNVNTRHQAVAYLMRQKLV